MAQHKIDSEFKNKLDNREIQPSAHAWDRLDAMLNEAEGKKAVPVRKLNWLYIAAGFIGLLLLGTMFFNLIGDTAKTPEKVVIETEKEQPSVPEEQIIENLAPAIPNQQNPIVENQKPAEKKQDVKKFDNHLQTANNQIADNTTQPITNNHQSINHNQQPNVEKAPINVDELLASANLNSKPVPKKPTLKVDPNSLLSQVDGELELSFRETVINTVSKKYQKVKVAVADRNQE